MDVSISARHVRITPRLEEVIQEKIGELDRYLDAAVLDFDGQVTRDPEVELAFRRLLGTTFHRLQLHDRAAPQLERAVELGAEPECGECSRRKGLDQHIGAAHQLEKSFAIANGL